MLLLESHNWTVVGIVQLKKTLDNDLHIIIIYNILLDIEQKNIPHIIRQRLTSNIIKTNT